MKYVHVCGMSVYSTAGCEMDCRASESAKKKHKTGVVQHNYAFTHTHVYGALIMRPLHRQLGMPHVECESEWLSV